MERAQRPLVALALVLATAGCAVASVMQRTTGTAAYPASPCALPTLPAHGSPASMRLTGPAVAARRGGGAAGGFSPDGGGVSITPPPAGAGPAGLRGHAEGGAPAPPGKNGKG